jgi:phosphoserine aminotransferase
MRAYNFCAGPAALPTAVLEKAQQELLDWQGKGCIKSNTIKMAFNHRLLKLAAASQVNISMLYCI